MGQTAGGASVQPIDTDSAAGRRRRGEGGPWANSGRPRAGDWLPGRQPRVRKENAAEAMGDGAAAWGSGLVVLRSGIPLRQQPMLRPASQRDSEPVVGAERRTVVWGQLCLASLRLLGGAAGEGTSRRQA